MTEIQTEDNEKCLTPFVMNVEKIAKFHSDHPEINQYFVVNVLKNNKMEANEVKEETMVEMKDLATEEKSDLALEEEKLLIFKDN